MKIVVCGVPPNKVRHLPQDVDIRCVRSTDTDRTSLRQIVPDADLYVIIPKHMSHKQMGMIQRVAGRNYANAATFNHAVQIVNDFVKGKR